MKEYKIVCNRTETNLKTGEMHEKKGVSPIIGNGTAFHRIYTKKSEANAGLKWIKEECKNYDANREKNIAKYGTDVYTLSCTQTDIKIVSRAVTPWM